MKATECLNTEHGVLLTQLAFLERLQQGSASNEVLRAVTLAVAAAVENHRQIEERFLYPAIVRECGEGSPIQVMEAEHGEIEACIRGIDALDRDLPRLVRAFIDILRRHIGKEINVLFPMAEMKISAAELERMACQCVEHYHQVSGVTKKPDRVRARYEE